MKRFLVLLILATVGAVAATPAARPNFLIILSDDQGYDDLSSHGNKFAETPRLDRLAGQSLEFTRFYVDPACAPTRASLLTGRSFVRTGVWSVHFGGDYLPIEEVTFADRLGAAGYATGCYGKWHSGKTPGYLPADRGFQEVALAELYVHRKNAYRIGDAPKVLAGVEPYRAKVTPQFAADRLADDAIAFLRRNRAKPFCLYLPHIAVHSPWEAPSELMAKYQKKGCSPRLAALYGLLEQMDTAIGRVLDELDALALAENTVVFFLSDNGMVHNTIGTHAGKLSEDEARARNVSNLRGTKGTIYDGGIRSPLMVRWPGKIRPGKTDTIGHATDIFPTLLELAGVPATNAPGAAGVGAKPIEGRSLKPLLMGEAGARVLRERTIHGSELGIPAAARTKGAAQVRKRLDLGADRASANYGLARLYARSQRFKLVKRGASRELFDMAADPSETTDVAGRFPEEVAKLEAGLKAWFEDVLTSERPYQWPVYQIGRPGAPGAVMHFNGARKLTGDFAGVGEWAHYLAAAESGSSATFAVRVVTPGRYRVVLQANVKAAGYRAVVRCGEATTAASLEAAESHELGVLDVSGGAEEMVFSLEKLDPAAPGIPQLWNLVLLRPE